MDSPTFLSLISLPLLDLEQNPPSDATPGQDQRRGRSQTPGNSLPVHLPPAWVRWYGETGTSGVQENPQEELSPMPLAQQPLCPPKLRQSSGSMEPGSELGAEAMDTRLCDLGKLLSFRAEFGFTAGWLAILVGFKVLPFPLTAPSGPRN